MTCAEFERDLAAILGGTLEDASTAERLAGLRRHAASCPECAGASDLVEWAALPREERDVPSDPGESYWASFDGRLRVRIRREEALGRRRRLAGLAAAAAALATATGLWLYVPGRGRPVAETPAPAMPVVSDGEGFPLDAEADLLAGFYADDGGFPVSDDGLDDDADSRDGGFFTLPPIRDLDAEGRRKLIEWLREQNARIEGGPA